MSWSPNWQEAQVPVHSGSPKTFLVAEVQTYFGLLRGGQPGVSLVGGPKSLSTLPLLNPSPRRYTSSTTTSSSSSTRRALLSCCCFLVCAGTALGLAQAFSPAAVVFKGVYAGHTFEVWQHGRRAVRLRPPRMPRVQVARLHEKDGTPQHQLRRLLHEKGSKA